MKDVLTELDRWQQHGDAIALATLVEVHGSAPRLPGARMLVTRSGKMAGSVSGGCVENDIVARALLVLSSGEPVLARYGIADDSGLDVGLTCASLDVLIEPFDAGPAWQAVRRAVETRQPVALCIGLAPAGLVGRKLAVAGDGGTVGSITPALDAGIAGDARQLLAEGGTRVVDSPEGARVFVEALLPPLRLYVVGGTHTAVALARMAKQLGLDVTVIDARSAYLSRERFPDADVLVHAHPARFLDETDLDGAFVVTLTHDLKFDVPTLGRALRSGARYVGAMGSGRTHEQRLAALRQESFTESELARIRTPIGLDIGSRTPEEIALAILAEIVAVRSGRDGGALVEKKPASRREASSARSREPA